MRERLGEVPVAVLEKGKQAGLASPVRRRREPAPAARALPRPADDGRLPDLRRGSRRGGVRAHAALGVPHPAAADDAEPREPHPLGVRARPLPRRAGRGARRRRAPRDRRDEAARPARARRRRAHRRPRPRAAKASRCRRSSRATTSSPALTVLAEGTQGYLTSAAIDQFGLEGENPQIWALGVKEVWRVPKPLRKIVHTMGWPLRTSPGYGEFGGSFIYPMGDDLVTIGFVAGLEAKRRRVLRARRPAGVQDAPARVEDPRRRRARRVGREDDHRGRLLLAPAPASTRRGCCSSARARGSSTCRG